MQTDQSESLTGENETAQAIATVITAAYEALSFAPGGRPDWDRFRALYFHAARLTPAQSETNSKLTPMTVEEFIRWADEEMRARGYLTKGFHETDVHRVIEWFGDIAQVLSTYESRFTADEAAPFARGLNSFQLLRDDGRWQISSVIWDLEQVGQPIPAKYLPKGVRE